jgi:hypothetical protein
MPRASGRGRKLGEENSEKKLEKDVRRETTTEGAEDTERGRGRMSGPEIGCHF